MHDRHLPPLCRRLLRIVRGEQESLGTMMPPVPLLAHGGVAFFLP